MATFVKISNGTVVQFNVLFIFVMAWCWFNATNLSRETLAEILPNQQTINRNMTTQEKPTKDTLENWHKDPNNWKWGIFYFNKDDKRIFPPKRNKYLGWTVNFANPISIISLVAITTILVIISKYLKSL